MALSRYSYQQLPEREPDFRIVLVGKTGTGKSAVGNTILGTRAFQSRLSVSSVTSVCEKETTEFAGLNLAVIDTPGLFDTNQTNREVVMEIARCISMAAPGPHVFLIVIQPTRFTTEEEKTVEIIKTMFGEEAVAKYTMVLFTRGDELREANINIEDLLETSQPLKNFISQCSILQTFEDKYHVFDNKVEDSAQVRGLVEKINRMVHQNGGYYTNEMFIEAQRAKREEMERLLSENPGLDLEEARRRAERDNTFIRNVLKAVAVGATVGAAVGGAVGGTAGGPVGAAVGATVGVTVGAAVGATVGAAVGATVGATVGAVIGGPVGLVIDGAAAVKEKACIIQ